MTSRNGVIKLPHAALQAALWEGIRRHIRAVRLERVPRWNHPGGREAWGDNLEGACAECAYALWRGVFWAPLPHTDADEGDVLGDQVHATGHVNGHMPVTLEARKFPDARHVLLIGAMDAWTVVGWAFARDVTITDFHRTPTDGRTPAVRGACFYVPQTALCRDLEALR